MAELSSLGNLFARGHRGRREMPWWKQMLIVAAAKPVIEGVSETVGEVGKSIFLGTGGKDVFDTTRGKQLNVAAALTEDNLSETDKYITRRIGQAESLEEGYYNTLKTARRENASRHFLNQGEDGDVLGETGLNAFMAFSDEELRTRAKQLSADTYAMRDKIAARPTLAELKLRAEKGDHWYAKPSGGRLVSKWLGRLSRDGLTQDEKQTNSLKYMAFGDSHNMVSDEDWNNYLSGQAGRDARNKIRTSRRYESDEDTEEVLNSFINSTQGEQYKGVVLLTLRNGNNLAKATSVYSVVEENHPEILAAIQANEGLGSREAVIRNVAQRPGTNTIAKFADLAFEGFTKQTGIKGERDFTNWLSDNEGNQNLFNSVQNAIYQEVGLAKGVASTGISERDKAMIEKAEDTFTAFTEYVAGDAFKDAMVAAHSETEHETLLSAVEYAAIQRKFIGFNMTLVDAGGNFGYIRDPQVKKGFLSSREMPGTLGIVNPRANVEFLKTYLNNPELINPKETDHDLVGQRVTENNIQKTTATDRTGDSGWDPLHPQTGVRMSANFQVTGLSNDFLQKAKNASDDPNEQKKFVQNQIRVAVNEYVNGAISNNYVRDDGTTPRLLASNVRNLKQVEDSVYSGLQLRRDTPSVVSKALKDHDLSLADFGIGPTEDIKDVTKDEPLFDITDTSDKNLQQMIDNSLEFKKDRPFASYNLEEIKGLDPKILNRLMKNYAEQLRPKLTLSGIIEAAKKGTEAYRQVREGVSHLPNSLLITYQELRAKDGLSEREAYEEILRVNTPAEIMRLHLIDSKSDEESLLGQRGTGFGGPNSLLNRSK